MHLALHQSLWLRTICLIDRFQVYYQEIPVYASALALMYYTTFGFVDSSRRQ